MVVRALAVLALAAAACCPPAAPAAPTPPAGDGDAAAGPADLRDPRETHLGNLTQLTFGGENAEAYWSFGGDRLIFQTTHGDMPCDQIMTMDAAGGGEPTLVSTGKGRTTCSYFLPGDQQILYASTHGTGDACPPPPDRSHGYVWALYDYDIYRAAADGSDPTLLFGQPGASTPRPRCARPTARSSSRPTRTAISTCTAWTRTAPTWCG